MRFAVANVCLVGFNDVVLHGFGFKMDVLRYASHTKFFKRKKEKKESRLLKWRVSKKQVF
jgi:hypothetical protein